MSTGSLLHDWLSWLVLSQSEHRGFLASFHNENLVVASSAFGDRAHHQAQLRRPAASYLARAALKRPRAPAQLPRSAARRIMRFEEEETLLWSVVESGMLPVLRSTERCKAEIRVWPPSHGVSPRNPILGHDAKRFFRANGRRVAGPETFLRRFCAPQRAKCSHFMALAFHKAFEPGRERTLDAVNFISKKKKVAAVAEESRGSARGQSGACFATSTFPKSRCTNRRGCRRG